MKKVKNIFGLFALALGVIGFTKSNQVVDVEAAIQQTETVGKNKSCVGPGSFCGKLKTVIVVGNTRTIQQMN